VHTAWITAPGIYLDSPENERFRDSSLGFLLRLQEFGTTHVVGLGTCIEYEIGRHRLSEEHTPVGPTTTYARCKNELRLALSAAAQSHGFRFCWGRVFYPYGPGEHPSRLCSSILRKLSSGEKILLKTPLSTKDYIYIEDLAAAVLTVVEQNFSGIINLGTGTGVSVGEVARRLAQIVGKPNLVEEANPPEADPFPFVVADSERLRSLGWEPSWALERGLMQLAESVLHE
jgi:nucleoside-diphosphate-sugar epimerase